MIAEMNSHALQQSRGRHPPVRRSRLRRLRLLTALSRNSRADSPDQTVRVRARLCQAHRARVLSRQAHRSPHLVRLHRPRLVPVPASPAHAAKSDRVQAAAPMIALAVERRASVVQ